MKLTLVGYMINQLSAICASQFTYIQSEHLSSREHVITVFKFIPHICKHALVTAAAAGCIPSPCTLSQSVGQWSNEETSFCTSNTTRRGNNLV
jgi:hypothetical protein